MDTPRRFIVFFFVVVSKRTVFTNVHSDYVKNSILKASLPFVLEHGWSVAAIEEGARTISCPRDIYKGLLGKGDDLALYFYKQSNEKLRKLMKTVSSWKYVGVHGLKIFRPGTSFWKGSRAVRLQRCGNEVTNDYPFDNKMAGGFGYNGRKKKRLLRIGEFVNASRQYLLLRRR